MKMSVYTGTNLVFETKNNRFTYPKGAFIQLEVDKNDDPIVVHHRLAEVEELSDPKDPASKKVKVTRVESKYLRFTRLDDLRFVTENIFFEDQFSPVIELVDTTMADALLKENISPDLMTAYLSDKNSSLQKSYVKDGVTHIRIPVRPLSKDVSVVEKLKTLSKFDRIDTSKINTEDVSIISAQQKNRLQETKYLIMPEALYNNADNLLLDYICGKLREAVPKDWRVRVVEDSVRVTINGAAPYTLYNILETIPVSIAHSIVKKDDEDSYIEIIMKEPDEKLVVESFYTKQVAYDDFLVEDDGNEEKKEGDACQAKGKKGRLKKSGDSFVCMVDESYEDDLDRDEVFLEGDSCGPDGNGILRIIDESLCCVVENTKYTQHYSGFQTLTEQGKEGDACEKDGKKGELCKVGDSLVCKIKESQEEVLFACMAEDAAMPREGDPCEMHGQPGKLMLVNGALICSLGGEPPLGAPSVGDAIHASESLLNEKKSWEDREREWSWAQDKKSSKKKWKKLQKTMKKMPVHGKYGSF